MYKFQNALILEKGTQVFLEALRQPNAGIFFSAKAGPKASAQALAEAYVEFIRAISQEMAEKPRE